MLKVYHHIASTKTLGPYNRFALWVSGCEFNCPNCMTPDAQPLDSGEQINIKILAETIKNTKNIEGLTITGGEPFLQAKELNKLLDEIQKLDLGIIVYTGYTKEKLVEKNDVQINLLLNRTDLLIDGLYIDELNVNDTLKGSSNQIIHKLSNRYHNIFDRTYNHKKRDIEIHFNNDDIMVVGIPKKNMLSNLF